MLLPQRFPMKVIEDAGLDDRGAGDPSIRDATVSTRRG